MPAPKPTRLFHITAIANLPAICAAGALLSKNGGAAQGINYQNIAYAGAQGARARRRVPDPPGGSVHDFVPFYFAPRSPMLGAINKGKVGGCDLRQGDILHLETTVEAIVKTGNPFLFYDRNATLDFSKSYTDLGHLDDAIAWDLLTESPQLDGFCKYWNNRFDVDRYADRMERRMAEFLVKHQVPLAACTRCGVIDGQRQAEVQAILSKARVDLDVQVMSSWYF